MKIHFFIPYPLGQAPSQRFRFELFLGKLHKDHAISILPFYTTNDYLKIKKGGVLFHMVAILKGFLRRISHIFHSRNCDIVFIHREVTPMGPPFMEFILARILRKKIIYDFDDAIWLPDPHESGLAEWIKWKTKISKICRWSQIISCGNVFLANYASSFCSDVRVIPTVIDPEIHKPASLPPENDVPVIGWTGSSTTLVYLESLFPTLLKLHQYKPFQLIIIADKEPEKSFNFVKFIQWSQQQETEALTKADIGIMPLPDDEWARGKCGFKLIQYGAVGLPSVASKVGVNPKIILQGESGFLCENEKEWIQNLRELLDNKWLRESMGEKARRHIVANYSVQSTEKAFLELFK